MDRPALFDEMRAFNHAEYLAMNPDVAKGVEAGELTDAWIHYELCGRGEGRKLCRFDEAFYVRSYALAAQEVAEGRTADAFDHYLIFGSAGALFAACHGRASDQPVRPGFALRRPVGRCRGRTRSRARPLSYRPDHGNPGDQSRDFRAARLRHPAWRRIRRGGRGGVRRTRPRLSRRDAGLAVRMPRTGPRSQSMGATDTGNARQGAGYPLALKTHPQADLCPGGDRIPGADFREQGVRVADAWLSARLGTTLAPGLGLCAVHLRDQFRGVVDRVGRRAAGWRRAVLLQRQPPASRLLLRWQIQERFGGDTRQQKQHRVARRSTNTCARWMPTPAGSGWSGSA